LADEVMKHNKNKPTMRLAGFELLFILIEEAVGLMKRK
jgi:hypothetical protein